MAAASSAGWALGFALLPLRDLCGGGDRAQTRRPVALRTRRVCLRGGLETVWEDVIKVMLAFLLMAPLLTHAAALLGHGFVSGCTQRGAGAEEAFPLYEKVSYKCSLIIWGIK